MSLSEFPYIVIEHHENRDFPRDGWCAIEYLNILRVATPNRVIITNMTKENQKKLSSEFKLCAAITEHSLIDYVNNVNNICQDPNTPKCLAEFPLYHHKQLHMENDSPQTAQPLPNNVPGVNNDNSGICFLDEFGTAPIVGSDLGKFRYLIFGGILGDHPSIDRGGHLRNHGFAVRHLGPRQMSTDTAVLSCCTVLRHDIDIEQLTYIDDPEVYEDEIDNLPHNEQPKNKKPQNITTKDSEILKTNKAHALRESTAVRMRYLTQQQDVLDSSDKGKPQPLQIPENIELIDNIPVFPCFSDHPQCVADRKRFNKKVCTTDHSGDWYHSRPQSQADLYKKTKTLLPRITPGLLEHIFSTLDDGLFDLEGQLDIDFEAMEYGIDDAEDKELCDMLFFN